MSHVPCGLGGATSPPLPACWATINEAPISVRASASVRTILVLVFMFILICLAARHLALVAAFRDYRIEPSIQSWFCPRVADRRDERTRVAEWETSPQRSMGLKNLTPGAVS